MKLAQKFLIISLFLAFVLLALGIAALWLREIRKPPEKVGRVVVKQFSFKDASDLKEFQDKLLAGSRTRYSTAEELGKTCVKAVSEDSASAFFYQQELVPERRPFVNWDWRAGKFPVRHQAEALDEKSEFDFVAQFYVIFSSRFFLNAKAIQYVWTEKIPVGTVSDSPYTKNVKIMVLQSGPSEEWKHEERNISEDFENLFGKELEKNVDAISFMTDSDSTGTSALAYFGNITLGYLGALPEDQKRKRLKRRGKRSKRFPFLRER
ncbi:MAG: DUF3047 domain-containing protein [Candidatus Omnitrophota bacterium]